MPTPIPLRPISRLTVLVDACVYRHNPAIGDQLASLFSLLKKAGVECRVVQDRFCLLEATNHIHELMLSEDIETLYQKDHGSPAKTDRVSKYVPPEYVENYLRTTERIAAEVPITYVNAPGPSEMVFEREELVRTHLFGDPRLHTEWPAVKKALRNNSISFEDLDDYHHSLLTTCVKCAHTIEAIHQRMKRERGFAASLTAEERSSFMLDKYKQGHKVHWDMIDLPGMDTTHIPTPVVDAFSKTKVMQKLIGKGDQTTPFGRQMLRKQMDLGEKVMENQARVIADDKTVNPPSQNVVLLITDDNKGLDRFEKLEQERPNCTPITSRELANIIVSLANTNGLRHHFTDYVVGIAQDISSGKINTSSPCARDVADIKSGDTSFVNRVHVTSLLPKEMRERL